MAVVSSLRDLPEPADLAFILTPVQAVEGVLDDMGAAGIPSVLEVNPLWVNGDQVEALDVLVVPARKERSKGHDAGCQRGAG